MKYRLLLPILRTLIYLKRFLWWLGQGLARAGVPLWNGLAVVIYPIVFRGKRILSGNWLIRRDFWQVILLAAIVIITLPQTKLLAKPDPFLAGRKTLAFVVLGPEEVEDIEEIFSQSGSTAVNSKNTTPAWRQGVAPAQSAGAGSGIILPLETISLAAGGQALLKPIIIPGALPIAGKRSSVVAYEVQAGDSLGAIAAHFGVSVTTVLWENNLTERSLIRPGDILKIPPTSGIMHTIKRGDTLKRIAALYGTKPEEIIDFNNLNPNGTDLKIGERLMIPGGVKPRQYVAPSAPRTMASLYRRAAPPGSSAAASAAGFIWPSAARALTQYFSWRHSGIDIAGAWQSPIYSSRAGVVEKSQCGWNGGYGCYVIIDHGGGLRTLYGHSSVLLVSPGESVQAGQTIALMGNTGHVRGKTGIHVHFEIFVNGRRVNPLGYVR